MAARETYNAVVAARTRAARQIRDTPDMFALFAHEGGLKRDLDEIARLGEEAAVLDQAQSGAVAGTSSAVSQAQQRFALLQVDYKSVMRVVRAIGHDLAEAGAPPDVQHAVGQILVDETQAIFKPAETDTAAAGGNGEAKRKKVRSASQEAVRAEIEKDAAALVALKPIHKRLAERNVDLDRLKKLLADAQGLTGQLADKAVRKGASKDAVRAVREKVQAQSRKWGACYPMLAAAGAKDQRIRQLLLDAARKR